MADDARALLDQLMGAQRNDANAQGAQKRKRTCWDDDM